MPLTTTGAAGARRKVEYFLRIYFEKPISIRPFPPLWCCNTPAEIRSHVLVEQEGKGEGGGPQSDIRPGGRPFLSTSPARDRYGDFRGGVAPRCGAFPQAALRLVTPLSG
jgi:hypothetical protein